MLRSAPRDLPASLSAFIDYRKSGLSLNHVVGCPLDCGYCVRHLFDNYDMKKPHRIVPTEEAVEQLVDHWAFQAHRTPIQIFNRATDPFLPKVKDELFETLEALDRRGLTNLVLVITRWHVTRDDVVRLDQLQHLRVTILCTWSGIEDHRLEPVDQSIAAKSLETLFQESRRTRCLLYWRPLILGINDTDAHIEEAVRLSTFAHATAFTGLFMREEIRAHLRGLGLEDIYDDIARRKVMPQELEQRILSRSKVGKLFRKTSCAVAHAWSTHDYNGHVGLPDICDICPPEQVGRCKAASTRPRLEEVLRLACQAGLNVETVAVEDDRILVSGSREEQRYFLQHSLNFQVHDRAHPHRPGRHGRAEIGWTT